MQVAHLLKMASTPLHRILRLSRLALAAPLAMGLIQAPLQAATIGDPATANYDQAVLGDSCFVEATNGSLGFNVAKSTITSNAAVGTEGSAVPAQVGVVTNLTSVTLVADTPTLTFSGGTPATHTGDLRFGSSGFGSTNSVELANSGSANLDVRFVTTSGAFANGNYTATAIITCTDNGTKTQ